MYRKHISDTDSWTDRGASMLTGYKQMKQFCYCMADDRFVSFPFRPSKLKIVPTTTTTTTTTTPPTTTTITDTDNVIKKGSDTLQT